MVDVFNFILLPAFFGSMFWLGQMEHSFFGNIHITSENKDLIMNKIPSNE